jgi:HSP20 family protein
MLGTFRTWNPLAELNGLHREMNRLFNRYTPEGVTRREHYPPVNVWRSEDGMAFTVSLPGYEPDDVEITTTRNTLTIRGRRQQPELSDNQTRQRNERHYGEFLRTFDIPSGIDPEKTNATFNKGVLLISHETPEEEKTRKVRVKAG